MADLQTEIASAAKAANAPRIINAPAKFRSFVWKYFGFPAELAVKKTKQITICKLCFSEISYTTGTTSNMTAHLKRKHNIVDEAGGKLIDVNNNKPNQTIDSSSSNKGQLSLHDVFKNKLPKNSTKAESISKSIGIFIAKDMRPYSIVDNEGFKNMLNVLEPRYEVPSRTYFSANIIPNLHRKVKSMVEKELNQATYIALTTDAWTSRAADSYNTVTAHFIDVEWDLKSYCLGTRKMEESHTGENLSNMLTDTIKIWKLSKFDVLPALTTDNASNIMNAGKLANIEIHIRCFAHTLNLATQRGLKIQQVAKINTKIRRVVAFFHRSNIASALLKHKQILLELPEHKLIIDVSTRWNSTYDMITRYIEQQNAVEAVLLSKDIKKHSKDIVQPHHQLIQLVMRLNYVKGL